jgi:hypothetical protein
MEIAFEEHVDQLDQKGLAFLTAALNIQMIEHFAPKWGIEPWPVKSYKSVKSLPVGTYWPIAIQKEIGAPGADGFHDYQAGLAYGRVRWTDLRNTGITASHEDLELRLDPRCNRWMPIGKGYMVAIEACDPCEGDSYEIEVNLFGEKRKIAVSDFLLPSYFKHDGKRPFTWLDTIDRNVYFKGLSRNGGGYLLVKDPKGRVTDFWGKRVFGLLKKRRPANWNKHADHSSRFARRMAGLVGEVLKPSLLAAA